MQAVIFKGINEGFQDMSLASHLLEIFRTPLSCQYLIRHMLRFVYLSAGQSILTVSSMKIRALLSNGDFMEVPPASHTPAHELDAAAAPFRA